MKKAPPDPTDFPMPQTSFDRRKLILRAIRDLPIPSSAEESAAVRCMVVELFAMADRITIALETIAKANANRATPDV